MRDPLPYYDTAMGMGIPDPQDTPITGYCELCDNAICGEPYMIGDLCVCQGCHDNYKEDNDD